MAFVALNPQHEPAFLTLPSAPTGYAWRLVVDTAAAAPSPNTAESAVMALEQEALAGGAQLQLGQISGALLLTVPVVAWGLCAPP